MILLDDLYKDTYTKHARRKHEALTAMHKKIHWCKQQIALGAPIQGKLKSYLNQSLGKGKTYRVWQFVGIPNPGLTRSRSKK